MKSYWLLAGALFLFLMPRKKQGAASALPPNASRDDSVSFTDDDAEMDDEDEDDFEDDLDVEEEAAESLLALPRRGWSHVADPERYSLRLDWDR